MFRGFCKCRKLLNVFDGEIKLFKIEPKATPNYDFEVPRKSCRCCAKARFSKIDVKVWLLGISQII